MMRSLALVLALSAAAACGGSSTPSDDVPADDTPPGGDTYSVTWGPLTVQPGVEDTACITVKLANPSPIKVHQLHNTLSTVSHHFIVYRDNTATEENLTPTPCQPFAGTLNPANASPIMITQRSDETLTLPDGIAYSFGAKQFIRLEMHYINAGDVAADATATAEFVTMDEADVDNEADFMFIGSPDINFTLAPGDSQSLQAYFAAPSALDGINFFALTGHTHQLGTDMNVSTAASEGGAETEIYNPTPFLWNEPETKRVDFTIPSGGGFDFSCTWTNNGTASKSVQFGESANDEMCFFWTYYYPSRGARVCVHSAQIPTSFGGPDLCCPDAGPQICNLLTGKPSQFRDAVAALRPRGL